MVMEFGFSDKLGPLRYETNQEEVFLGHSVAQQRNISDETARIIDEEVRKLVEIGEETSRKILTKKIDDLHKVAKGLLEYETLSAEDINNILSNKEVIRANTDIDTDTDNISIDPKNNKPINSNGIKNPTPNET
jgi:cell division protease FtsH